MFQPPRSKTAVLKDVNFLGEAKVLSSVVDNDKYTGFVGVQVKKITCLFVCLSLSVTTCVVGDVYFEESMYICMYNLRGTAILNQTLKHTHIYIHMGHEKA